MNQNSKISLFVLAAGMGSRYGGLKQMEGFGPNSETIIDYSIYDAIKAGFHKIVFVIRPDMEEAFKEIFMSKYQDKIDIQYTFQTTDMLPSGFEKPLEREKPWGTGHALLVAKDILKEPFLIINGDDFYGKDSFKKAAKFLQEECNEKTYAIPAYKLENVLSDNGTVKRGVCEVNDGKLVSIEETFDIQRVGENEIEGVTWDGKPMKMTNRDLISMNMFCVHNSVFPNLEKRFEEFLQTNQDPLKGEFLLPVIFSDMIQKEEVQFEVLQTEGQWFGVTYPEDGPVVREKLKQLTEQGVYPSPLMDF